MTFIMDKIFFSEKDVKAVEDIFFLKKSFFFSYLFNKISYFLVACIFFLILFIKAII